MTSPEAPLKFRQAPLNEFVLGVQFAQMHGYQQIYAGEVWSLFRDRFPHVQELPALTSQFETFGIPQSQRIDFGIVTEATHDRFWFLSPNKQEIIQFQHDRLLHNWREVSGDGSRYPSFEVLIDCFAKELNALNDYMKRFDPNGLVLNQCEISYTNRIRPEGGETLRPEDWLTFVDFKNLEPSSFQVGFKRTISGPDGRPLGRIYCDAASAFDANGKPFIALTLVARGAPATPGLEGALEFLVGSREKLGKLFVAVTTEAAQRTWGRV